MIDSSRFFLVLLYALLVGAVVCVFHKITDKNPDLKSYYYVAATVCLLLQALVCQAMSAMSRRMAVYMVILSAGFMVIGGICNLHTVMSKRDQHRWAGPLLGALCGIASVVLSNMRF